MRSVLFATTPLAASRIFFVNDSKPRHQRIRGRSSQVIRRLLMALGVADPRKRSAMLHEFFVEPELAIQPFDDRYLIVVVVDVEARRETGADRRQRRSIA